MTSSPRQFRQDLLTVTPQLRAYGRALCRAADKADDLLQDTLLCAWERQDTLRDASLLKPWVFAIMRNLFRRQQRYGRFTVEDIDDQIASSVSVSGNQETATELRDVTEALSAMPADHREAIVLIFVNELSYHEAASLAGCAVGTMKSRVNRARRHLSEKLGILTAVRHVQPVGNIPLDNAVSMQLQRVAAHGFAPGEQAERKWGRPELTAGSQLTNELRS